MKQRGFQYCCLLSSCLLEYIGEVTCRWTLLRHYVTLDAVDQCKKICELYSFLIWWWAVVRFGKLRQVLSWGSTLPAKLLEETAEWKACKLWSYDGSNNDLCNRIWTVNHQHPVSHMIHWNLEDFILLNGSCAFSKSKKVTPTFFFLAWSILVWGYGSQQTWT